ncbi:MAG: transport-associated protein, partial [Proteobacteria bacterium]|nr:transport-associated protein [Pseudomonadota bacterium]
KISVEEFKAQGGQEQAFREADANRDNSLSNDEHIQASANDDRDKPSRFMGDVWITTKVRSLLLKEEGVKGLGVNVETYQGTVQLSGWVNTPTQIAQAEKIFER